MQIHAGRFSERGFCAVLPMRNVSDSAEVRAALSFERRKKRESKGYGRRYDRSIVPTKAPDGTLGTAVGEPRS